MQEQRARLSLQEKGEIIEMYIGKQRSIKDIAELLDLSVTTITRTVSLYFKKPKKSKVLLSKV